MAPFTVEAHKKKVFLTISTQVYQYTNANFANEVFFYEKIICCNKQEVLFVFNDLKNAKLASYFKETFLQSCTYCDTTVNTKKNTFPYTQYRISLQMTKKLNA